MRKALRTFGAAFGAFVTLGLAVESCGVTSSSSDCAEKATCPDDGGGGAEATGDDMRAEVASSDDTSADMTNQDDASADVGSPDVGSERVVNSPDANNDVKNADVVDVVDAPVTRPDGCVPMGTEDCTNGIDDNCDGLVDCADPLCQAAGYSCATVAPTGWIGPVALYEGVAPAQNCPAGYAPIVNAKGGGLTAPSAQCGCTCTAGAAQCAASAGQFYSDATICATACAGTVSIPSGVCTATAHCGGASVSFNAPAPAWVGGACTPQPTKNVPAAIFGTSARVCSWSGTPDVPGGCNGGGDQCVKAPTAPYGTRLCIYQSGDPAATACPPGPYSAYHVYYSGLNDTRSCTTCSCGGATATGGSCSGTIDLYSGSSCTGTTPRTFAFGTTTCLALSSPQFALGTYAPAGGGCGAGIGGQSAGSASATGATTVCCM